MFQLNQLLFIMIGLFSSLYELFSSSLTAFPHSPSTMLPLLPDHLNMLLTPTLHQTNYCTLAFPFCLELYEQHLLLCL